MKTHLDLFSGIGGFALAARWCGLETVGFCDKEPYAQEIIKARFGAVVSDAIGIGCAARSSSESKQEGGKAFARHGDSPTLHPDIFTLNGSEYRGVDLLTGGFPCQPFSVAGKRAGAGDDRALWPEMRRVIEEARPRWIIAENVPGIIGMELDNCLSDLEATGYEVGAIIVPACAVDARHRRSRVWIMANRSDARIESVRERKDTTNDIPNAGRELSQGRVGESTQGATERESEFRVGRMAHGLPTGMDGCSFWPDEDPNTPRFATGIANRAHRLKGLGNAIVPQVACQLIRMIMAVDRNP